MPETTLLVVTRAEGCECDIQIGFRGDEMAVAFWPGPNEGLRLNCPHGSTVRESAPASVIALTEEVRQTLRAGAGYLDDYMTDDGAHETAAALRALAGEE